MSERIHKIFTEEELAREIKRIKSQSKQEINWRIRELAVIRKELNILSRMTKCIQTRNEILRLSNDVKAVYERLRDA